MLADRPKTAAEASVMPYLTAKAGEMENVKVNDLQDWQKSTIFAMLMGRLVEDTENPGVLFGLRTWEPFEDGEPGDTWIEFPVPDFYEDDHMKYAWRVLNWAWMANLPVSQLSGVVFDEENHWLHLFKMPPKKAVQYWLNEILKLAAENNMIDWSKLPFKLATA